MRSVFLAVRGCEVICDAGVTFARGGALDNPAPRSARGMGAPTDWRPRRRPLQDLARREHFVVAASAATTPIDARFPRAERGAGLSSAPPRAAVIRPGSLWRIISSKPLRVT